MKNSKAQALIEALVVFIFILSSVAIVASISQKILLRTYRREQQERKALCTPPAVCSLSSSAI